MENKDITQLLQEAGVEIAEENMATFNKEFRKSYKSTVEFNNKINALSTERDEYKTKYDDILNSSNNNDAQIQNLTSQLNEYKTKYETSENNYQMEVNKGKVSDAGVDKRYTKFVTTEVLGKVTDKVDFDTALQNYITENPQYKIATEPVKGTKVVKVNSAMGLSGEGAGAQDVNSIMNNLILRATGRK